MRGHSHRHGPPSEKGVEMSQTTRHRDASGGVTGPRRMRFLLCAATLACAMTTIATGSAADGPALRAPDGLKTFVHHLSERAPSDNGVPVYSRTPSFVWAPVRGATHYEFELATSDRFLTGNGLVWSSRTLATPAAAVPLSLPWITGQPASLYWRVRAVAGTKVSAWSEPKGFSMRWTRVPTEWKPTPGTAADRPGYVRWHPVDGATGYQVWFVDVPKVITTITNVADQREFYAFHDDPAWTGVVRWRVRAIRATYGNTKNTLPAVAYGPWSPTYSWANTTNPLQNGEDVKPAAAISNSEQPSVPGRAALHNLMPALLFTGNGNSNYNLHRVYVFSDSDCVNVVYKGAIVGGPAYAPRASGPLALPGDEKKLGAARVTFLPDGEEGATFTRDTAPVTTTESTSGESAGTEGSGAAEGTGATPGSAGSGSAPAGGSPTSKLAQVDLWDRDFPKGRYYFAVVPVEVRIVVAEGEAGEGEAGEEEVGKVEYHDAELSQDACQGGPGVPQRVLPFGKESAGAKPVSRATGLSTKGRLLSAVSAVTQFYGAPLVTWEPAPAAVEYDLEWSRSRYPWRPAGTRSTPATSMMLPLTPGTWWYRVRGVNHSVPGNQKMAWSPPVKIRIASPTFSVAGG